MKSFLLTTAAAATLAVGAVQLAPSAETQTATPTSAVTMDVRRGVLTMAPLLERATPAVVNISTSGTREVGGSGDMQDMEDMMRRFFGDNFRGPERNSPRNDRTSSVGSGVIVDAREGLIMTNAHVVRGADEVQVTLTDRRVLDAEIMGTDPATDIAILKVEARGLSELDFADSEDIRVGDYVIAIGNPFGLGQTVTSGIVSALGRTSGTTDYSDFIQTDASINPGNSGGALINSKGELVGINTAIISRSGGNNGIGFAVPANMAEGVMRQLVEYGEVRRGRIGVLIADVTPTLQEAYDLSVNRGALVQSVSEDTPAEKAGLKAGDVIIGFNGEEIVSGGDIRNTVGLVEAGTRTDITYLRDGKRRTTQITVEAAPEEEETAGLAERLTRPSSADMAEEEFEGATVTDIPSEVETRGGDEGVYVANIERGSRAFRGGLRRGDIIRRVDRRDVEDLDSFADLVERRNGATAVEVERDGQNFFLAIR